MQPTIDPSARLADILKNDLGVKESYRHTPKWITPGDPIETSGAILKWYALAPQDEPVPEEIDRLARAYLAQHPLEARGLGFVHPAPLRERLLFPHRQHLAREQRTLGNRLLQERRRHG